MHKLIIPAALALTLSAGAALAQNSMQSTTTESTPDQRTTTTTTRSDDGYTQYRKTVTSTEHFKAGPFAAPSGYTYTRYTIGDHVPAVVLHSNLRLSDYASYRLASPPSGLEWIRVGNDALLVVPSTGEVIQTDYDLFD